MPRSGFLIGGGWYCPPDKVLGIGVLSSQYTEKSGFQALEHPCQAEHHLRGGGDGTGSSPRRGGNTEIVPEYHTGKVRQIPAGTQDHRPLVAVPPWLAELGSVRRDWGETRGTASSRGQSRTIFCVFSEPGEALPANGCKGTKNGDTGASSRSALRNRVKGPCTCKGADVLTTHHLPAVWEMRKARALQAAILQAAAAASSQPPRAWNTKHTPGVPDAATWFRPCLRLSAAIALPGEASRRSAPSTCRQRLQSTAPHSSMGRGRVEYGRPADHPPGDRHPFYYSDDFPERKEPAEIAKGAVAALFQKSKMLSRSPSRLDPITAWLNPFLHGFGVIFPVAGTTPALFSYCKISS